MNVGEDLAEPPEGRSGINIDPLEMIEGLKSNSQKLQMIVEVATVAPTRTVMNEMQSALNETTSYIRLLHDSDFFRGSQNTMLVGLAFEAYLTNLKAVLASTGKLNISQPTPGAYILLNPPSGEEDPLEIEIIIDDEIDAEIQKAAMVKFADGFADLMVSSDPRYADNLSKQLLAMNKDAVERMLDGLEINPVTAEFLKKDARRDRRIANAKKIGWVTIPAVLAGASGGAAFELMSRYL